MNNLARIGLAVMAGIAGLGMAGCTSGYGYDGVSLGYGSGGYYGDPYYAGGGYGYADPYYGGGYGYGSGYFGWYGDFYYPGTGIYVYDRYRRPFRWNDSQRRYWEGRRNDWRGQYGQRQFRDNWDGFTRSRNPGAGGATVPRTDWRGYQGRYEGNRWSGRTDDGSRYRGNRTWNQPTVTPQGSRTVTPGAPSYGGGPRQGGGRWGGGRRPR